MPKGVPHDLVRLEIIRVLPEDTWITTREIAGRLRQYDVSTYVVARFLYLLKSHGFVQHRPVRDKYDKFSYWRLSRNRDEVYRFVLSKALRHRKWLKHRVSLPINCQRKQINI